MRRFLIIALSLGAALVVACGGDSEPESLPTDEATPNVQATVQALVRATVESLPTPTPTLVTPTNTPVPTSTPPPPRPTATRISASTSTPTPGPTGTPFVAIITPTLVPIPPPTSTPRPTATPSPIPTPTATPVPPSPTPTPTIFDILDDSTPAVVRITAGDKQGSGFIIKSDGVIITANHLVSVVSTAEVELADGRKLNGNVVGRHIAADLAVLQISAQDLPTIPLGDSDELMPGDLIFKVGYATESSSSDAIVKAGIITAFTVHKRSLNQVVQTDEPLKAGDSGGPLLNRQGEVIGVSSANIVVFEEEGAGYASTINQLSSNLNQLLAGSPVCPPTPTVFDGPTFRHNSFRYDVILPKGSNFGSDQQSDFVFLGRDTPRVGVTIHNPTSKKFFDDIESFFDSTLEDVKGRNNIESVEILDFRPVCLISIGDAIEVDVKVRAGSQNFLHRWLLFFTGSDAYFLEGSAPVSSWPVSEKWIDSLMYSFTF